MYESCINAVAKSIAMNCTSPLVGGYTGRGVLIPWDSIGTITQDSTNPRKVLAIGVTSGAQVIALDNAGLTTPLEGSTTAGNADSGYAMFAKTLSARILSRGADVSKDLVEPLVRNANGFIAILEKNDKVGDGSYEVVGLQSPLKVTDPSTVTRTEAENGGAISFSMTATEFYFEVTFAPTPSVSESQYHKSHLQFEALLANAFDA